jgi:hypothetical protein
VARKKRKDPKPKGQEKPEGRVKGGPLQPALDTFDAGDYAAARAMFDTSLRDPELSEENRRVATAILASIKADPTTLLVGLGCAGLYALTVVIAALLQP